MRPFLSVALAGLLAGACNVQVGENGLSFDVAAGRARDEWVRTYTLPEGGRFSVVNVNGQIQASAGEGRDLQVVAQREARAGSEEEARALLEAVDMGEEVSADSVRIEARSEARGRRSLSVSYRLRIPSGLSVMLKTENGEIRLENVNGNITAETTNGGINARSIAGSLTAEVVNGGIEVELASVTGDINVSSVNGGIELDVPGDVRASLEATCVNGGISVDERLRLDVAENSRRRVAGTLNGGGPRIVTNTVNGGVRIRALVANPS